jgi:hypothetical protein
MIIPQSTHEQYQNYLLKFVTKFYISINDLIVVAKYSKQIIAFYNADLSPLYNIIKHAYTGSKAGSKPKDPIAVFRSLLLMVYLGFTSIDEWVVELRSVKMLAIISGFLPWNYKATADESYVPDTIPGVGTFYDFMDRLVLVDKLFHKSAYRRPKKNKKKPKPKLKKGEKLNNSRAGVIDRICNRVSKMGNSKLPDRPESRLNSILKEVFVLPSIKLGLLGNPSKFNFAGDSTNVKTSANPYGKRTCDCKSKGIINCDCVRKHSDPNATWGWDSTDECYFFGHVFHHFTAADSPNDLPIIIKTVSAKRFDGVTGVYALKELVDLYPEFDFYSGSFDKAYDAIGFYRLLTRYRIAPIIDINERHKQSLPLPEGFDNDGYFICPSNYRMIKDGIDWSRRRHKNRCPHAVSPNKYPCNKKCSQKPSGRTVYNYLDDNPRVFCPIPRNSELWKLLYNKRTTTERCNDRIKNDFNVKNSGVRSLERWTVRFFLGAFCMYLDTWYKNSNLKISDLFPAMKSFKP